MSFVGDFSITSLAQLFNSNLMGTRFYDFKTRMDFPGGLTALSSFIFYLHAALYTQIICMQTILIFT